MGRKSQYSKELKLSIVKRYLDGEGSTASLAKEINATDYAVRDWVKKYQAFGESAFDTSHTNASYTKSFKELVVLDYLNGRASYDDLAIKYHIPSSTRPPGVIHESYFFHNVLIYCLGFTFTFRTLV